MAESFSKLLSSVSCGVLKSFRSSDRKGTQGIEYGIEWYPELMKNLDAASDVVCLLTQRSIDRPWILYEAGVAKGKLDTPVYGIALGIPLNKANNGPFAQFQNCDDNEDSLTKLVMQLVRRIPNSEPDQDANRKSGALSILGLCGIYFYFAFFDVMALLLSLSGVTLAVLFIWIGASLFILGPDFFLQRVLKRSVLPKE